MIRVLLVDDSSETLEVLSIMYRDTGACRVMGLVQTAEEALAVLAEQRVDLVSIDIRLRGACGLQLCREVRRRHPEAFLVVCSMEGDVVVANAARAAGADVFVSKPLSGFDVAAVVQAYRNWVRRDEMGRRTR
ncbi:response regulator [Alicyclobacillus sp.]|uniref:response regulator n=1 Tax=Alicyclobacillus sp. TaxID=61169 RepID=UPI0025BE31A2|nr:response regulator [Alicyclobacillus sp.]MCL6517538.1 response regulator [Alicyclobacillus sp.]